jgi:hypothetical protein
MQELINDAAKAGNLPGILRGVDVYALPTLDPNFGFVREIIRLHARLFTPAVVALLLGGTGGGRHASTDRVREHSPQPLFSRHLRSFKKTNPLRLPPGTPCRTRCTGMGCCAYPMRGVSTDRGSPPPKCPAGRRWDGTALMCAAYYGHHEIVERLIVARADLNTKNSSRHGCALPRGPSGDLVGRRLCRLRLAPSGRWTALHYAAVNGRTKSAVALLVGGADQTVTNNSG